MCVPPPTVETDLACITCDYNLRTLPSDGKCPECGEPIWRTRCTRPDIRAFKRFQTGQLIYGLTAITCFCMRWYAESSRSHTTNTSAPENVFCRYLLSQTAMASFILILIGLVWVVASPYPWRSKFVWSMLGLNVITFLLSLLGGGI